MESTQWIWKIETMLISWSETKSYWKWLCCCYHYLTCVRGLLHFAFWSLPISSTYVKDKGDVFSQGQYHHHWRCWVSAHIIQQEKSLALVQNYGVSPCACWRRLLLAALSFNPRMGGKGRTVTEEKGLDDNPKSTCCQRLTLIVLAFASENRVRRSKRLSLSLKRQCST